MDKIDPGPGYRLLEPDERIQEGDEWLRDDGAWRPVGSPGFFPGDSAYRRKLPTPSDPATLSELGLGAPEQAIIREAVHGYHDAPKEVPFTRNKYTRDCPSLDGRVVPVDVYCVSEAFPLDKALKSQGAVEAVLHARKKLFAPGQRGAKSALQDVQEAWASLARAIALEEAAQAREGKGHV